MKNKWVFLSLFSFASPWITIGIIVGLSSILGNKLGSLIVKTLVVYEVLGLIGFNIGIVLLVKNLWVKIVVCLLGSFMYLLGAGLTAWGLAYSL